MLRHVAQTLGRRVLAPQVGAQAQARFCRPRDPIPKTPTHASGGRVSRGSAQVTRAARGAAVCAATPARGCVCDC
jgi:hypothetical protein